MQDLSGELVGRLARAYGGALLSSDECRKARGLQLLQHGLRVRFDLEGSDLNLVEVFDLHHVGVEAFRFDLSQHGVCVCFDLKGARLDAIQAPRRLFRLGLDIRTPEAFVDRRGNLGVPFVEVCTGAALIRKPPVHGHVLLVRLTDKRLVGLPLKLLDTVALANVDKQVDKRGVGLIRNGVRLFDITGDLNRDCAVIVRRVRGAPRTVFLLDVHTDTAVIPDTVVAGRLPRGRRKHIAEGFDRALPDHAMDSYGIDFVVTRARFIWRDFRIVYKWTVTHFQYLLRS